MAPILQAVNALPLHVALHRREILLVRGSGRLHCEAGAVWLTESGSTDDAILAAGDDWPLRPGIDVVLSASAGARLSIGRTGSGA
ncbi:MAG TPA: DUF2917 domain-containing protein [Azonexus sp.]